MKKMPFKNGLEMWHRFAEYAEWLKIVAETEEQILYSKCKFYSWNNDAFEENCLNGEIERETDFNAKDECWKCKFYAPLEGKVKSKNEVVA